MAHSYVEYTATSGQTQFGPVTFTGGNALDLSHIKAYLNGNLVSATVSGTTSAPIVTLTSPAALDNTVRIVRETPYTAATRLIDFVDGDVLTASDLDTANLNALHAAQQAYDKAVDVKQSVDGAVTTVFGRQGVVVAQANDYTASMVTNAVTTDSTQTISGAKTFSAQATFSLGTKSANLSGHYILHSGGSTSGSILMGATNNLNISNVGGGAIQSFCGSSGFYWYDSSNNRRMLLAPTGQLTLDYYGAGTLTSSASGVVSVSSDENMKVPDGIPADGVEKVKALSPKYFFWKDEAGNPDPSQGRQLGFFAQEVNQVCPEAAPGTGGKWGIYDRSLVALLVKAVQELTARVEALEGA